MTLDREKYLSKAEVKRLRTHLENAARQDLARGRQRNIRTWAMTDTLLSSGIRATECRLLKIRDLRLTKNEPQLFVAHAKGKKNGKPRTRWINIPQSLRKHLLEFLAWKKLVGDDTSGDSFLFPSRNGRPFSLNGIQKRFKSACRDAGLDGRYSIHATRHSFASHLFAKSHNLRLVQQQLGHASVRTCEVYVHILPGEAAQAVDGLWG